MLKCVLCLCGCLPLRGTQQPHIGHYKKTLIVFSFSLPTFSECHTVPSSPCLAHRRTSPHRSALPLHPVHALLPAAPVSLCLGHALSRAATALLCSVLVHLGPVLLAACVSLLAAPERLRSVSARLGSAGWTRRLVCFVYRPYLASHVVSSLMWCVACASVWRCKCASWRLFVALPLSWVGGTVMWTPSSMLVIAVGLPARFGIAMDPALLV